MKEDRTPPAIRLITKMLSRDTLSRTAPCAAILFLFGAWLSAQPTLVDQKLVVSTAASNLVTPVAIAFFGPNEMLVIEKDTGKVQRIQNTTATTVLDLAVNAASERGLLDIALHPAFPADPGVYLFWTESLTGIDTAEVEEVPLLGNRVDRFEWDGSALTFY